MDRIHIRQAVIGEMVRLARKHVPFQPQEQALQMRVQSTAREGCPVAGVFVPQVHPRTVFLMSKKDFDAANKLLPLF